MIWASPLAWALTAMAVLPLVAHLWSRRRPTRVPFPTLRFLRSAEPVSRRLRRVRDWPLLMLRLAIVAAICAAAAGPTLVSSWRARAWHARLHRITIVGDPLTADAAARSTAGRADAATAVVLGPGDVGGLLDEAIAQATVASRDRQVELEIAWDGSLATLTPADLARVPAGAGIRLVIEDPGARPPPRGAPAAVTIHAAQDDVETRERALRALRELELAAAAPIDVWWPGAAEAPPQPGEPVASSVLRALDDMADDVRVREAALRSASDPPPPAGDAAGRVLACDARARPVLRGWGDGGRLVLALDAAPTSPVAWWALVSAVESLARLETHGAARWTAAMVAAATRSPRIPTGGSLPGGLDTRAAWVAVLVLLGVETWWRRRAIRGAADGGRPMPREGLDDAA